MQDEISNKQFESAADAFDPDIAEWKLRCAEEWLAMRVRRNLAERFCDVCGAEYEISGEDLHCKRICNSCGFKRDCSDP
jgi:hypothetical protein